MKDLIIIIPIVGFITCFLLILILIKFGRIWYVSRKANVPVRFTELMLLDYAITRKRLKNSYRRIIKFRIDLFTLGISIPNIQDLINHIFTGGDAEKVLQSIKLKKGDLNFTEACSLDLNGKLDLIFEKDRSLDSQKNYSVSEQKNKLNLLKRIFAGFIGSISLICSIITMTGTTQNNNILGISMGVIGLLGIYSCISGKDPLQRSK